MFLSLERRLGGVKMPLPGAQQQQPPTLASQGEQLSKAEVVQRQQTRGLQKKRTHAVVEDEVEAEGSRRKNKK